MLLRIGYLQSLISNCVWSNFTSLLQQEFPVTLGTNPPMCSQVTTKFRLQPLVLFPLEAHGRVSASWCHYYPGPDFT